MQLSFYLVLSSISLTPTYQSTTPNSISEQAPFSHKPKSLVIINKIPLPDKRKFTLYTHNSLNQTPKMPQITQSAMLCLCETTNQLRPRHTKMRDCTAIYFMTQRWSNGLHRPHRSESCLRSMQDTPNINVFIKN